MDLGEAVWAVRPLLFVAELGVCGLEVEGVRELVRIGKCNINTGRSR